MNTAVRKWDLLRAAREMNDRGLVKSARWASELAITLPRTAPPDGWRQSQLDDWNDLDEYDSYSLSKSCFDCKEFDRAAFYLKGCTSLPCVFLRGYSAFLGHKKRIVEGACNSKDNLDSDSMLESLKAEFGTFYEKGELDGYGLYLYGIILKELGIKGESASIFLKSVHSTPYLWSAWQELADACETQEDLDNLDLPSHWMANVFKAYALVHLRSFVKALDVYKTLVATENVSKDWLHLKSQMAIAHYGRRKFHESRQLFKEISSQDPYRLDNMDIYSNVLFVLDMKSDLSHLAHHVVIVDKYRPQTCCIVGNYCSLRGDHEKAVQYFKRALSLDSGFSTAWTLLGHEYMELKNIAAAVETYRKAVDLDPREFKAWYGLGQTYEVLKMPLYSLHYYQKAYFLQPQDSRMLIALGGTYERLKKYHLAEKYYSRAVADGDVEDVAALQLAKLYEFLDEDSNAAEVYTRLARRWEETGSVASANDVSHCYRFLVIYHMRVTKNWTAAEAFALKCCELAETMQEGKSFLQEISQLSAGATKETSAEDMPLSPADISFT
ncbi:cell division cycle protein 23 homolog [Oscarella lobularis]|uniref:cell division cycle protein 23 homolog n=1 Tax=Oscarella lobularis TaxID=121494 RepID=UPI003313E492